MSSKLIVIEGLDGSGKTTQADILKKKLEENYEVLSISLPDYDDPSSTLVKMYLSGKFGTKPSSVNAFAASTFYAVDRYASFKQHWGESFEKCDFTIANRYTTSNCCHQMTKLPQQDWDEYINWLYDLEFSKMGLPKPDLVIFLDMPVEVSQNLLLNRYEGDSSKKDIHEDNVAYLLECRKAAMYSAKKLGWQVVSCAEGGKPKTIEAIFDEIFDIVKKELI